MTPEEIEHSERYDARSPWHRAQRIIKLHVGSIEKWKQLAARLAMTEERCMRVMLETTVELTLARRIWLSPQEWAKRLAPGAAAYMAALGLAENRAGQVVLLDVERTVKESLVRRNVGLRSLPAKRARNLEGQLADVYCNVRGEVYGGRDEHGVIELLRAKANDRTILARWKRALLSNGFPPVRTLSDLARTWAQHAEQP